MFVKLIAQQRTVFVLGSEEHVNNAKRREMRKGEKNIPFFLSLDHSVRVTFIATPVFPNKDFLLRN
jgi:hypothetical protein